MASQIQRTPPASRTPVPRGNGRSPFATRMDRDISLLKSRPSSPATGHANTEAASWSTFERSLFRSLRMARSTLKVHNAVRRLASSKPADPTSSEADGSPNASSTPGFATRLGGGLMLATSLYGMEQGFQELHRGDAFDGALDLGGNGTLAALGGATLAGSAFAARWVGPVGGAVQAVLATRNLVSDLRSGAPTERTVEDGIQAGCGVLMAASPLFGPAAPVAFAAGAAGSLAVTLFQHRAAIAGLANKLGGGASRLLHSLF